MPLATHGLLATDNIHQARDHLSSLFWPHRLKLARPRAPVSFRHNRADLGSVSLNALQYGSEVIIEARPSDLAYLVKFTLAGASELSQDRDCAYSRAGMVCVMNPTRRLKVHLSEDHNQLTLRVDGDTVRKFLEFELGTNVNRPVEFLPGAFDYSSAAPGLGRIVRTLCSDLDADVNGFSHPRVSKQLEQTLIGLMLSEIPHTYSSLLQRSSAAPVPAHMARAIDYIHACACSDISLEDLVRVSGSSARALQAGFRRHVNMTPMSYLRNHRLELARLKLERALDEGLQVADVAYECGFTHLSRFAAYYRAKFGEMPSTARARGHRRMRSNVNCTVSHS